MKSKAFAFSLLNLIVYDALNSVVNHYISIAKSAQRFLNSCTLTFRIYNLSPA